MALSKTPKSDSQINPILESLAPHTRICLWKNKHKYCEGEFNINDEDIEFLRLLRVPAPSYCPTCRRIRRASFMGNNRLFKRTCNVPGHMESIISILPEECPFPVYDYMYFISDEFDPFSFGIDWDKDVNPMELLSSLRKNFPMPSFLNRDSLSLNSDYSNGGRNLKNGYFAFGSFDSENVWYSSLALKSKDIMDSRAIRHSEFVYNSLDTDYAYKSSFIYFSTHIVECMFMFDCRNCDYCFGCVNLRNKKYHIYNEQVTKEQYELFLKSITPITRDNLHEYKERFWSLVKSLPLNASHTVGSRDVTGISISNSNNVHDIVDSNKSEHVRHADSIMSHKDSMDVLFSGGHSHHLYETINIGSEASWVKFSVSSKYCTDSEYIFNSKNLSNCFMCFGLQNKSYCVLNKQYEPDEYYKIVDDIKSELIRRGEYADGLNLSFSAQPYNFSLAHSNYPLTDEEIRNIGGFVGQEPETNAGNMNIVTKDYLPQTINETKDDILNVAILCEETNRPFRIIESELLFLKKMGLPLPTIHPTNRMNSFAKLKPIAKKYKTKCEKCKKDIESIVESNSGYKLYCEKCYQQEVI